MIVSLQVCPRCRLLQSPSGGCAACGASDTSTVGLDLERHLERRPLAVPPAPSASSESRFASAAIGLCAGLVVAGMLAGGALAGGLGAALGAAGGLVGALVFAQRRGWFAPARPPTAEIPLLPGPGATHAGEVERAATAVAGPLSGLSCVAVTVAVAASADGPHYFWSGASPGFWLKQDDGQRLFVAGLIWIDGPVGQEAEASKLPAATGWPKAMLAGAVAVERRLEAGARVSVSGTPRIELLPGVSYRDVHERVLRGSAGRPLVVEVLPRPASASTRSSS